ncbi:MULTISPECIES: phosphopantetheine-binding protein [Rahnella]|jgi:acyl carrier protein|uniref:Acyl carrier protein n=1 Tax=Rahnella variigena TaxID=574964 RepID=A0ABX9Q138_9GAMM|nr:MULTISPECIES: phosphopantetheine-binding protein [Rahnella]RBQ33465.1 acyl carrier protein [Rahnella aquatilis]RJT51350.1 acyl carrier protein [Rahnella variigena]RKF70555.1 acyl carrier protein [Rahnella variigena]RYJ18825.1 acyl carrier protein [Rahnella variigena]TCQ85249.1 acyl carrier protein [Rahnella sp. JUb53]
MDSLSNDIKVLIITTLNLEGMTPDEIETQAPLFGDGLGLDSIDALELGLALKKQYGVILSAENQEMREHFYSVESLARFISVQRG